MPEKKKVDWQPHVLSPAAKASLKRLGYQDEQKPVCDFGPEFMRPPKPPQLYLVCGGHIRPNGNPSSPYWGSVKKYLRVSHLNSNTYESLDLESVFKRFSPDFRAWPERFEAGDRLVYNAEIDKFTEYRSLNHQAKVDAYHGITRGKNFKIQKIVKKTLAGLLTVELTTEYCGHSEVFKFKHELMPKDNLKNNQLCPNLDRTFADINWHFKQDGIFCYRPLQINLG